MNRRKPQKLAPLRPTRPVPDNPIPPGLSSETNITIDGQLLRIHAKDLVKSAELGRGQYGRVERMVHKPTGRVFAVKLLAIYQEDINRTQIKKDLEVGQNTTCPCVVMCYGGLLHDSEVMVLMELMDISLDVLRNKVYSSGNIIPEDILAYMIQRVVTGLEYLHSELRIMHRDVKPSNMLADRHGLVKVCDFGISGDLVKSFAMSNVGTNRYLAPERINPPEHHAFSIHSDVWSLGLSIIELATGTLCYANLGTIFEQMQAVVSQDPLRLPENDRFSEGLQHLVSCCLVKDPKKRANYLQLLDTPFLQSVDISSAQHKLASFLSPLVEPDQ